MADCVNALKAWTGKANATIVYDSAVDEFTDDGLFAKVKGKRNVAIVGFTTDGDVFGGFYSVSVTEQEKYFKDPDIFAFSFKSHGRCSTPRRFAVRAKKGLKKYTDVKFWKHNSSGFIYFGVGGSGGFWLGNERTHSYCCDMSRGFKGLKDTTLTGKDGNWHGPFHRCTRLVAVQLDN